MYDLFQYLEYTESDKYDVQKLGGRRRIDQRRRSHNSLIMQFSQLNNDVIVEIFLQFVAIDWDRPFTLILVCNKWSNLVVSQPRLWTWIMVDDTQAEWKERMEVAAHLSKNLPLQIVLRIPFVAQVSLSHITRRCTSLFADSKYLEDLDLDLDFDLLGGPRSWAKTIVSYEEFTEYSTDLKQSHDSLLNFLKGTSIDDIQIRNEDRHHTSFAYSAWHVYERLNQRASIQEVLTPGEMLIITSLVFKHGASAPLPRIQLLVTDLWGLLPFLSNLSYLELAENYIRAPRDTVLAHIQLRSLQTLKIESPMMSSVFFSLEEDVWLGLLSLLAAVEAPNLEDLSLQGPLHRTIAAIIKNYGRFHLLQLNISISLFDETVDQEELDGKSVWHGLRRFAIAIPEQNKARRHTDTEVVGALRLLFNLIPRHCSVQLHGGAILELIMQSDLLMDIELHIVTQMDYSGDVRKPLRWPHKIRSSSITWKNSEGRKYVPWISSVEELQISCADYLWRGKKLTLSYPNGPPLAVQVLECIPYTLFKPKFDRIGDAISRDSFSNLTKIKCDHSLAAWLVTNHETPQLRSLTLRFTPGGNLSELLDVVEKAGNRLLSLDTLGITDIPEWEHLLPFVANFNRSRGRGISTVKLRDFPHPAMLYHLGRAFKGETEHPDVLMDLFQYEVSQLERHYPSGCEYCRLFGWSCCDEEHCSRGWSDDMVSITADMPLAKYDGGWGPDGQGWEHDLLSSSESEMDTEHENAEDTNENSGE